MAKAPGKRLDLSQTKRRTRKRALDFMGQVLWLPDVAIQCWRRFQHLVVDQSRAARTVLKHKLALMECLKLGPVSDTDDCRVQENAREPRLRGVPTGPLRIDLAQCAAIASY
jgi:uncharacterized protein (UPF0548 family)